MGSSRLPGKTLSEVNGKPLLGYLLDRLELCPNLDGIVVATTTDPRDHAIEDYCNSRGVPCFRGSEDDVLGRMIGALQSQNATIGVEVYGDCPLIDPGIVHHMIDIFLKHNGAYEIVRNNGKTTYPPGMECEVFSMSSLIDSAARTDDPAVREHGTKFVRQNPDLYPALLVEAPAEFHRPDLEIEIDTAEDFLVLEAIIQHFAPRHDFGLREIIQFLDANPHIARANQDVPRRWKHGRGEG